MTIRRQPADFIVRERLSKAWADAIRHESDKNHSHALLILSKSSIATPDAVAHVARALGLQPGRLAFAGLKDKHAQTAQHITVAPDGRGSPPRIPDHLSAPNWEARLLGWVAEPLTADGIDGNAFELVVRDLSRAASDEMARRADILRVAADDGPALLIVNYFGSQRFGGARHHQGWIGRALIEGDFESALRLAVGTPARKDTGRVRAFTRMAAARWGDWPGLARDLPPCPERRAFERLDAGDDFREAFSALPYFIQQMAVEAYQSHLWNRAAAMLAERLAVGRSGQIAERDLLRTPDPFGDMVFPTPRRVDAAWRAMVLPLLSRRTELRPEWSWAVRQVLDEERLEQDRLRIPGLRRPFYGEAPRPLFVLAEAFELGRAERDDMDDRAVRLMRRARFNLPRGAYATVALRALGQ